MNQKQIRRSRSWLPAVVGLDISVPAIHYALDTGLINSGWSEDLEAQDPSADLRKALQDVSLIICTGGASYVGFSTFSRIMRAIERNRNVSVACTVIRMISYDDNAETLRAHGLDTEKLPGVVLRQRKFVSVQEKSADIEKVVARRLDTTGFEDEGPIYRTVRSSGVTSIKPTPSQKLQFMTQAHLSFFRHPSTMQLITLSTVFFIASALAADCSGNSNSRLEEFKEAYWSAREKMCSNSDCTYQAACTISAQKSVGSSWAKTTVVAELKRKNTGGKKGFKDCWDATEDIINQCVIGNHQLSGTWESDGQLYQFNGYFA
ncbi:hypothetical protein FAUST_10534 [Fusarium austroamericanum]|uniref:Uncharacterized protein n=1 Tax=Fusarium austroamericanum TaxID=282268 RepID=A0AAN5Z0L9_FUSAU|nr:hypothetical protein FAUST_10534 [Fusarium austroamericanum]